MPWQAKCSVTQQKRYSQNKDCDWLIVDLTPTAKTDVDNVQEACYYEVIEGLCRQMKDTISIGQIGAVATDDTSTPGYLLPGSRMDIGRF
jgi:hypothetical protein